MVFKVTITIECNGCTQPLGSMVFRCFWDKTTIDNDGFQWLCTIGPTMEWLCTIVEVYCWWCGIFQMIERFPIHRALALALRDVNLLKRLTTLNSYKTLQRRMQIIFWHFSSHIDTAVEMGPPLPFPRNKDRPNDYGKPSSPQPMPP